MYNYWDLGNLDIILIFYLFNSSLLVYILVQVFIFFLVILAY